MPPKTLVPVGGYIGILLSWTVLTWLGSLESCQFDCLVPGVVGWLCLSLAGIGVFLLIVCREALPLLSLRAARDEVAGRIGVNHPTRVAGVRLNRTQLTTRPTQGRS